MRILKSILKTVKLSFNETKQKSVGVKTKSKAFSIEVKKNVQDIYSKINSQALEF